MSADMSMFKKMKGRIADEVNSATNKLQNLQSMQIIDQLSSNRGPLIDGMAQNQLLPEHQDSIMDSTQHLPVSSQFSLIDVSSEGGLNEDEELNSETSPQHKLFDEHSIRRLGDVKPAALIKDNHDASSKFVDSTSTKNHSAKDLDNYDSVININDLSSDLEDEYNEGDTPAPPKENDGSEVEIDLLNDKSVPNNFITAEQFMRYKARFRDVVHAARKLGSESSNERARLESENRQLKNQLTALKTELDNSKQQHDSLLSISTSTSEKDDKSSHGSPQPTTKSGQKLKDLERLLAKCKESLKVKNNQIQALKDSLSEVEKFKDSNQDLRRELAELREAHETWTVSIAENKRVMHQELENKNSEMEVLRRETSDLKSRLNDSYNKVRQLKSAIQDLESRLVSTSAAHQKERESLAKELTMVKNNAIRQIQKEHERNIERIKLDFEKSIEALKQEILNKDEMIVNSAKQQQQLHDKNCSLAQELEEVTKQLEDLNTSSKSDETCERCIELENKLKEGPIKCEHCDNYQQQLHEMNTQLKLLTTANDDQEKEIKHKESELNQFTEINTTLKFELDELSKKNESLTRVLTENEAEMQAQQSQLNNSTVIEQELETLKKENASLLENVYNLKTEIKEKNFDLAQSRVSMSELEAQIAKLKTDLEVISKTADELRSESKSILCQNEIIENQRRDLQEQLVLRILSAMKNLETPNTSPGSDKSYESIHKDSDVGSGGKALPDPLNLVEDLSSLALDRSQAYMTATQRLQVVLLENTRMADELKRLKEELNNFNQEKAAETQCSLEKTEKLLTENQALIHDQQTYEEKIQALENEVADLSGKLAENTGGDHTYQIRALQRVLQQYQEENKRLKESQKSLQAQVDKEAETMEVPDSTQFKYLKNIVYQFMLGKEPLVLARVISAVFKFDKNQIELICRKQEAVQTALKQTT